MITSLTIIRYPRRFIPLAFIAMMLFRIPLFFNNGISFYKLMGSGKNGTFDKEPDLRQWAILSVRPAFQFGLPNIKSTLTGLLYGKFIAGYLAFFKCEVYNIMLEPIEGHGTWDKKKCFGNLPQKSDYEGRIAVLTRATLRLSKLKQFWANVAPVASIMADSPGFITSFGIGEIPWIKQATFSVWQSKQAMKEFAYGMKTHSEVIRKTRQQNWYTEDMFTRFRIISTDGKLNGFDPLKGKL